MTPAQQAVERLLMAPALNRVLASAERALEARGSVASAKELRAEVFAAIRNALQAGVQLGLEQAEHPESSGEAPVRESALAAIEAAEERGRSAALNERCSIDLAALEVVQRKYAGTPHLALAEDVIAAYGEALLASVAGR